MKSIIKTSAYTLLFCLSIACSTTKQPQTHKNNVRGNRPNFRGNQGQKPNLKNIFAMLDKNNDGKISLEEAKLAQRGPLKQNFSSIDNNNDGFITIEEFENFKPKRR